MSKLDYFKPEDFTNVIIHEREDAAFQANAKLQELVESWPIGLLHGCKR